MARHRPRTLAKVAQIFQVLSDETRLRIIESLEKRELCVADIEKQAGVSQSAVSHQLRTLRQLDLVRKQRRGRRIYYRIADGHVLSIIRDCLDHVEEKE